MSLPTNAWRIEVKRKLNSNDVLDCLGRLFVSRSVPEYIHSDNGAEFTAIAVREWISDAKVKTLLIEPGSLWENGYNESFNGKLRDELLNAEIFYTSHEAKIMIESWRNHYHTVRQRSALNYRPPAPQTIQTKPIHTPCVIQMMETVQ